jgi:MFS family permease
MLRGLRYPNYRLFFGGQSISLIGTWMQRLAVSWLVFRLTDSAFLLGLVSFAGQMPTFFIAPFAGVIVDRTGSYRILLVTQLASMIQALLLAALVLTETVVLWQVIVLSIALGCINAFDMPARQALLIDVVERRQDLGNAIALNSSMFNGARLIGPTVAGILIAALGEGICFLLNGLSYLAVLTALARMRIVPRAHPRPGGAVMARLREGFSYAFGSTTIRALILLLALINLCGMPYSVLLPIFAERILEGGPHTLGFLTGAAGVGALAAAFYLASRNSVLGLGRRIPFAGVLFGISLIAFSYSRETWLSLLLMIPVGFGLTMQPAASNTVLQTIVDDDKRGRVMSFYTMAFMGTAPIGSLAAGAFANRIGAPATLAIGGALCIAGSLVFARMLPRFRQEIHPVYVRLGILPQVAQGMQMAAERVPPPEQ